MDETKEPTATWVRNIGADAATMLRGTGLRATDGAAVRCAMYRCEGGSEPVGWVLLARWRDVDADGGPFHGVVLRACDPEGRLLDSEQPDGSEPWGESSADGFADALRAFGYRAVGTVWAADEPPNDVVCVAAPRAPDPLEALRTIADEHTAMLTTLGERVAELEQRRAAAEARDARRNAAFGQLGDRLAALDADDAEAAAAALAVTRDGGAFVITSSDEPPGRGPIIKFGSRAMDPTPPAPGAAGPDDAGPAGAAETGYEFPRATPSQVLASTIKLTTGSAGVPGMVAVRLARPTWDGLITMLDDHADALADRIGAPGTSPAAARALGEERDDVVRTRGLIARALRGA